MTKPYAKPELTSYERPNLGYYSASNAAATCQADCAAATCDLLKTNVADPCTTCDFPANACGQGLIAGDCI